MVNLFVVYRFIFPNNKSMIYDESSVFYSPVNYATLSAVGGKSGKRSSFNHAHFVSLFLNPADEIPYTEHAIAINTDTEYNYTTKLQRSLAFGLRGHAIVTHKLEPPYTTQCIKNYRFYDCLNNCVNNLTVTNLKRLAPLKYHKGGNMKQITANDINNSSRYHEYISYPGSLPWKVSRSGMFQRTGRDTHRTGSVSRLGHLPDAQRQSIVHCILQSKCHGCWLCHPCHVLLRNLARIVISRLQSDQKKSCHWFDPKE